MNIKEVSSGLLTLVEVGGGEEVEEVLLGSGNNSLLPGLGTIEAEEAEPATFAKTFSTFAQCLTFLFN